jgi:hypothetical protein
LRLARARATTCFVISCCARTTTTTTCESGLAIVRA